MNPQGLVLTTYAELTDEWQTSTAAQRLKNIDLLIDANIRDALETASDFSEIPVTGAFIYGVILLMVSNQMTTFAPPDPRQPKDAWIFLAHVDHFGSTLNTGDPTYRKAHMPSDYIPRRRWRGDLVPKPLPPTPPRSLSHPSSRPGDNLRGRKEALVRYTWAHVLAMGLRLKPPTASGLPFTRQTAGAYRVHKDFSCTWNVATACLCHFLWGTSQLTSNNTMWTPSIDRLQAQEAIRNLVKWATSAPSSTQPNLNNPTFGDLVRTWDVLLPADLTATFGGPTGATAPNWLQALTKGIPTFPTLRIYDFTTAAFQSYATIGNTLNLPTTLRMVANVLKRSKGLREAMDRSANNDDLKAILAFYKPERASHPNSYTVSHNLSGKGEEWSNQPNDRLPWYNLKTSVVSCEGLKVTTLETASRPVRPEHPALALLTRNASTSPSPSPQAHAPLSASRQPPIHIQTSPPSSRSVPHSPRNRHPPSPNHSLTADEEAASFLGSFNPRSHPAPGSSNSGAYRPDRTGARSGPHSNGQPYSPYSERGPNAFPVSERRPILRALQPIDSNSHIDHRQQASQQAFNSKDSSWCRQYNKPRLSRDFVAEHLPFGLLPELENWPLNEYDQPALPHLHHALANDPAIRLQRTARLALLHEHTRRANAARQLWYFRNRFDPWWTSTEGLRQAAILADNVHWTDREMPRLWDITTDRTRSQFNNIIHAASSSSQYPAPQPAPPLNPPGIRPPNAIPNINAPAGAQAPALPSNTSPNAASNTVTALTNLLQGLDADQAPDPPPTYDPNEQRFTERSAQSRVDYTLREPIVQNCMFRYCPPEAATGVNSTGRMVRISQRMLTYEDDWASKCLNRIGYQLHTLKRYTEGDWVLIRDITTLGYIVPRRLPDDVHPRPAIISDVIQLLEGLTQFTIRNRTERISTGCTLEHLVFQSVGMETWAHPIQSYRKETDKLLGLTKDSEPRFRGRHDRDRGLAKAIRDLIRQTEKAVDPCRNLVPKAAIVDRILRWLLTDAATTEFPLNDIAYCAAYLRHPGTLKTNHWNIRHQDFPAEMAQSEWKQIWTDFLGFLKKFHVVECQDLAPAIVLCRSLADLQALWRWPTELNETYKWAGAMRMLQLHLTRLLEKTHMQNERTKRSLVYPIRLWTHMFHPQEVGEYHTYKIDDSHQLRREEIEQKTRLITGNNPSMVNSWVSAAGKRQLQRMLAKNNTIPLLGNEPMKRLTKFVGDKLDEWIKTETFAGIARVQSSRPSTTQTGKKPSTTATGTKTAGKGE